MKKIAQLRWLAILAVFALLVAACSSSDSDGGSEDTSASETTATTVAAKDPIRVPAIPTMAAVCGAPC